jgi:regulator of nucleoside diphosphate kinase
MTYIQPDAELMPPIVVSEDTRKSLIGLAAAAERNAPDAAGVLLAEMERAQVVPNETLPVDAVQMGSIAEFRTDTGQQRRVVLVYPGEADIAQGRISILTPIGAALIGMTPGKSITWKARDGRSHRLTVLTVEPPVRAPARPEQERAETL